MIRAELETDRVHWGLVVILVVLALLLALVASSGYGKSTLPTSPRLMSDDRRAGDFPAQARQKLRAVRLYESDSRPAEIFDDIETLLRGRFIA